MPDTAENIDWVVTDLGRTAERARSQVPGRLFEFHLVTQFRQAGHISNISGGLHRDHIDLHPLHGYHGGATGSRAVASHVAHTQAAPDSKRSFAARPRQDDCDVCQGELRHCWSLLRNRVLSLPNVVFYGLPNVHLPR